MYWLNTSHFSFLHCGYPSCVLDYSNKFFQQHPIQQLNFPNHLQNIQSSYATEKLLLCFTSSMPRQNSRLSETSTDRCLQRRKHSLIQTLHVFGGEEVLESYERLEENKLQNMIDNAVRKSGANPELMKNIQKQICGPVGHIFGYSMTWTRRDQKPECPAFCIPQEGTPNDNVFDLKSPGLDCVVTAFYMLGVARNQPNTEVRKWVNDHSGKDDVASGLIDLLAMDWASLSPTHLFRARTKFYGIYGRALQAGNFLEPWPTGEPWEILEALATMGCTPWSFKTKDGFYCGNCHLLNPLRGEPQRIAVIGMPKDQVAKPITVNSLVSRWFARQSIGSSSDNKSRNCLRCNEEDSDRTRFVLDQEQPLPDVLIISLGRAELQGDTTPTRVSVLHASETTFLERATYRWVLSICSGDYSQGSQRSLSDYRVYHTVCDSVDLLQYDPKLTGTPISDGRHLPCPITEFRSTGLLNRRLRAGRDPSRTAIVVLERCPTSNHASMSEALAKPAVTSEQGVCSGRMFESMTNIPDSDAGQSDQEDEEGEIITGSEAAPEDVETIDLQPTQRM